MPDDVASVGRRRALRAIAGTLVVHAGLVATHGGEFWPLSIFPMFSRAARPWVRALVHDVTDAPAIAWRSHTRDELPGVPFALQRVELSANDLAKLVQLTDTWDDDRIATLRALLHEPLAGGRVLLLLRADGRSVRGDIEVTFMPLVVLSASDAITAETQR